MSEAGAKRGGLETVIRWLERFARAYLVFTMLVVLVFTFGQVLDRYLLTTGFDAFDQMGRLGLVWITFIGIALGFRERRTIRIELLDGFLPARLRRLRDLFFDLIVLGLLVVVHVKGWRVVEVGANQSIIGTPFTYALSYAAILAGTVLYGIFVLLRLGRRLGLALPDATEARE